MGLDKTPHAAHGVWGSENRALGLLFGVLSQARMEWQRKAARKRDTTGTVDGDGEEDRADKLLGERTHVPCDAHRDVICRRDRFAQVTCLQIPPLCVSVLV